RRAALALSRQIERRAPALATSKWWKEERHGVFLDYNQNAKDRTTCSAYSVRPLPDARVSAPLGLDEVADCNPPHLTIPPPPTPPPGRCRPARRRAALRPRAPTRPPVRWRRCWISRRATTPKASPMRRGRRTTARWRARRRASPRRARAPPPGPPSARPAS